MTKTKSILLATCLAIALLWQPLPLHAANITVGVAGQNNGVPTVYVSGEIFRGDEKKLAQLTFNRRTLVYLDSIGGDTEAGLAMGYTIKQRDYETVVFNKCLSMCSLMWLAGKIRWVGTKANIGFHAVYMTDEKGEKNLGVSPGGNAVVGAFLARLGYSDLVIRRLTETDPSSLYWLTADKAKELGIEAKTIQSK